MTSTPATSEYRKQNDPRQGPLPRRPEPQRERAPLQRCATWADLDRHFDRWSRFVPARLSGHSLIAAGRAVACTAAGAMSARASFASSYVTVSLRDNDLCELLVQGDVGYAQLAEFSALIGAEIPLTASCRANGPESSSYVRVLLRISRLAANAIDAELRYAGFNTNGPAGLPGFMCVSYRAHGLALLPADPAVPDAPQALLSYVQRYRQELGTRSWERTIKEQASQGRALTMPATARRMRYDFKLQHGSAFLSYAAGTIVTEQSLIDAIAAIDPNVLIALDAETKLKDLKPGQIRYKARFFATVPGLGMIEAKEGHVVDGADPAYIARLRAAGAQLEVFEDSVRAKSAVPA